MYFSYRFVKFQHLPRSWRRDVEPSRIGLRSTTATEPGLPWPCHGHFMVTAVHCCLEHQPSLTSVPCSFHNTSFSAHQHTFFYFFPFLLKVWGLHALKMKMVKMSLLQPLGRLGRSWGMITNTTVRTLRCERVISSRRGQALGLHNGHCRFFMVFFMVFFTVFCGNLCRSGYQRVDHCCFLLLEACTSPTRCRKLSNRNWWHR